MRLVFLSALVFALGSCGFFKNYSQEERWSYFEEWDLNTDTKIDKSEFVEGCVKDGFIKKNEPSAADPLFTKADEDQNGVLTGLEFYRWKVHMVPEGTDYSSVTSIK